MHIPDYKCFSICRPKDKNVRRHKASGGLAAYVHTSIRPGVVKVPLPGTEILTLKLKKDFFGLDNDTLLVYAYCVPASSEVLNHEYMPEDIFENLEARIAEFNEAGDVILMGDLNARTVTLPDYCTDNDDHIPITEGLFEYDTLGPLLRNNLDEGTNSYGKSSLIFVKRFHCESATDVKLETF